MLELEEAGATLMRRPDEVDQGTDQGEVGHGKSAGENAAHQKITRDIGRLIDHMKGQKHKGQEIIPGGVAPMIDQGEADLVIATGEAGLENGQGDIDHAADHMKDPETIQGGTGHVRECILIDHMAGQEVGQEIDQDEIALATEVGGQMIDMEMIHVIESIALNLGMKIDQLLENVVIAIVVGHGQ